MTYLEGTQAGYDRGGQGQVTDPKIPERLSRKSIDRLTDDQVVEAINHWLQHERDAQAYEREERRYDEHICSGRGFQDDELALAQPKYAELRTNYMRRPLEYVNSFLKNLNMKGKVNPVGGAFTEDEMRTMISEFDKRLSSTLTFCGYHKAQAKMIRSAVIAGEGYMHEGVRTAAHDPSKLEFFIMPVSWRNVWADSNSVESDLSDATHLFYVSKMKLHKAMFRWPRHRDLLRRLAFEGRPGADSEGLRDSDSAGFTSITGAHIGGGYSELDIEEERNSGGSGNPMVMIVQAYVRLEHPETGILKLYRCLLAYDEALVEPHLLSKVYEPYMHNMIPFSRLTFDRYPDNGQPYSPLARGMRGYEKVLTSFLRSMVRHATSKGIVVDTRRIIQAGMDIDKVMEEYRRQMSSPAPIIRAYGGIESIDLQRLEVDLQKLVGVYIEIKKLIDEQAGISPELLGAPSPNMAGVALEMKRDEAVRNFPTLVDSLREVTQGTCERILSCIEQFSPLIEYRNVLGPSGEITTIGYDGDASIKGNRMLYYVEPAAADRSIMRDQANALAATIQKLGDSPNAAALFPILIRMYGGPDSHKLEQLFKELAQISGAPIPPSLMTEEERIQMQEQQAAADQKRQEVEQLQLEDVQAEVDVKKTKAFQQTADGIAKLTKDDGGAGDAADEVDILKEEIAARHIEYERGLRDGGAQAG